MLLDPAKKHFFLQASFVDQGDLFSGNAQQIGHDANFSPLKITKDDHAVTLLGSTLRRSQLAGDVPNDRKIYRGLPPKHIGFLEIDIVAKPNDKGLSVLFVAVQALQFAVSTVHDHNKVGVFQGFAYRAIYNETIR